MKEITASIITIGDELLIGQVIDTNSAWIAQQLNQIGIRVKRRVAVADDWGEIWQALDQEKQHADIILITGGLGPTADDITKALLCKYFGGRMVVNEEALVNIKTIFENLKRPLIERNLLQAEVPDNCEVIINKKGTAPGMWFTQKTSTEEKQNIFISMPGVPHEMKGMMQDFVLPALLKQLELHHIGHRTLLAAGIGEAFLADRLVNFEKSISPIKLAYLPSLGMVRLRLSTSGKNKMETEKLLDEKFITLQQLVKEHIVTNKDEAMQNVVAEILLQKHKTLCTAESCTGGYISHLLTSIPGSSQFYDGSFITYSYKAKEDLLGVNNKTLLQHGAVSEEVVRCMAIGALKNLKSDYTIAVSGIMGPDGGIADKPVGTVWVAVGSKEKLITQKFHFRFERKMNIELTAVNALNMLSKFILEL